MKPSTRMTTVSAALLCAFVMGDTTHATIEMIGGNGDDELVSEDATSTVDMDGGHGGDSCVGGAITSNCEP